METILELALIAMVVYHFKFRGEVLRRRENAAKLDIRDASNQLRYVMAADFKRKRIMSKDEYRVFRAIEGLLKTMNGGHRVFAQTSLGEVIRSQDDRAFASINSKRADILVIDPFGNPVAAVEFQGGGHYQGNAAASDAVKREALRKAGVAFVEIFDADGDDEVKAKVLKALNARMANSAAPAC